MVVSGSSSGIGRYSSLFLAEKGYHVVAGVRKAEDLESLTAQSLKLPTLHPRILDVTSEMSCLKLVDEVKLIMEQYNVSFVALINNAGISTSLPAEFHDLVDTKQIFETNVFGALRLTQVFLPLIREAKGRIVMIGSARGYLAEPMHAVYSASKFALRSISDSFRRELQHMGISVSVVEPAYVKTEFHEKAPVLDSHQQMEDEKKLKAIATLYPQFMSSEKIAWTKKNVELGSHPRVVGDAIFSALTSTKPRATYPVAKALGTPWWLLRIVSWLLPDRAEDFFYNMLS